MQRAHQLQHGEFVSFHCKAGHVGKRKRVRNTLPHSISKQTVYWASSSCSILFLIEYCRKRYAHSKLAVIMQTRAIHNRYRSEGISSFSLHPGISATNLQSADPTLFGTFIRKMVHWHIMPGLVTVADGARTTLFCATNPDATTNSGQFFVPYGKVDHGPDKWTTDDKAVQELWEASNKMLKDRGY